MRSVLSQIGYPLAALGGIIAAYTSCLVLFALFVVVKFLILTCTPHVPYNPYVNPQHEGGLVWLLLPNSWPLDMMLRVFTVPAILGVVIYHIAKQRRTRVKPVVLQSASSSDSSYSVAPSSTSSDPGNVESRSEPHKVATEDDAGGEIFKLRFNFFNSRK